MSNLTTFIVRDRYKFFQKLDNKTSLIVFFCRYCNLLSFFTVSLTQSYKPNMTKHDQTWPNMTKHDLTESSRPFNSYLNYLNILTQYTQKMVSPARFIEIRLTYFLEFDSSFKPKTNFYHWILRNHNIQAFFKKTSFFDFTVFWDLWDWHLEPEYKRLNRIKEKQDRF